MAGHKDPEANADRKASSKPSAPSLEREGREPRPRHWDTSMGDGASRERHGSMGISCSTYYIKLHEDMITKERLMCVSHACQRERELDYLYTWLSRKSRA